MSQQTMTQAQAGQDVQAGFPHIDLVLPQAIGGSPVQVFDDEGNSSQLYLGEGYVGVGGASEPTSQAVVLQVQGSTGRLPLFAVYNTNTQADQDPEASIRFENASDAGGWWHMGIGGKPGPMTFFLWNSNLGSQQVPALALDKDGNLVVAGTITATQGFTGGIDGGTATLTNLPSVTTAPQGAELAAVVVDKTTGKLYAM